MTQDPLAHYQEAFQGLRVSRAHGRFSPHKPCMLLAVLDLAESGGLQENRITYTPELIAAYRDYFGIVAGPADRPNPYFPFFHLRSEGFWRLQPLPGREAALASLGSARSSGAIQINVAWASLDEALYQTMLVRESRDALRASLIDCWFADKKAVLEEMLARRASINEYTRLLRERVAGTAVSETSSEYEAAIRGPAFRRAVLAAYDYRCAASGWRIVLPDGSVLVEAAHLIPFAASRDDDPRNGIALAPNYHWAMDRHLIAPGPDHRWHVSPALDRRIPDYQPLRALEGTEVLVPRRQRDWPRLDVLEWRAAHLLAD